MSGRDEEGLWEKVKRTANPIGPSRRYARPLSDQTTLDRELIKNAVGQKKDTKRAAPILKPKVNLKSTAVGFSFNRASERQPLDQPLVKKIAKGREQIEARLDLHGMTQDQAYSRLLGFVDICFAKRMRTVLVITGKGLESGGILRHGVPRWLAEPQFRQMVSGWHESAQHHGGSGALYVRLRQNRSNP